MSESPMTAVPRVIEIDTDAATEFITVREHARDRGGHLKIEDAKADIHFETVSKIGYRAVSDPQSIALTYGSLLRGLFR